MMINAILELGSKIFDRIFPDKAKAQEAQLKLLELAQSGELSRLAHESNVIKEQSGNIRAEATSDSILARNWRPLLMLVFAGLIVARWFGWSAPNISQEEYMALWKIVALGVGGYVAGRSAEKIAKTIDFKAFLKKRSEPTREDNQRITELMVDMKYIKERIEELSKAVVQISAVANK